MIEHYKHPKKNNVHVFDLCFISVFRSIFGRPAVSKACKPCSKLSWPRSDGQKTLEFQGQRCDDFVHCKKLCWQIAGRIAGRNHVSMYCTWWPIIIIMIYYYMHSFFISLWEWETENERQDQIDKCCAFRIVLPQFSAKPLRMLGVPWLFRLVEGRDSITPSITSLMYHVVSPKKHTSLCRVITYFQYWKSITILGYHMLSSIFPVKTYILWVIVIPCYTMLYPIFRQQRCFLSQKLISFEVGQQELFYGLDRGCLGMTPRNLPTCGMWKRGWLRVWPKSAEDLRVSCKTMHKTYIYIRHL
jgi:hypothetical protein